MCRVSNDMRPYSLDFGVIPKGGCNAVEKQDKPGFDLICGAFGKHCGNGRSDNGRLRRRAGAEYIVVLFISIVV